MNRPAVVRIRSLSQAIALAALVATVPSATKASIDHTGGPVVRSVLTGWPDWAGGKRTLGVQITGDAAFTAEVTAAMGVWNTANAANNWRLVASPPEKANITIHRGAPGSGNDGVSKPKKTPTGLFGWGSGELTSVDITVGAALTGARLRTVILHELGHAMRLDDTGNVGELMHRAGQGNPQTPSTADLAEALASDVDPPCPFEVLHNLKRAFSDTVSFVPKPGAGINLTGVTGVTISPLTGSDFVCSNITWAANSVRAQVAVAASAEYNEVFQLALTRPSGTEFYTGVFVITDDDPPSNALPHAVGGSDVIVTEGTPVFLDGRSSYHDAPSIFIRGSWMTTTGDGLLHTSGDLLLPPGTHTAVLEIVDYYGRRSQDAVTVTVLSSSGPTAAPGWTPLGGFVAASLLAGIAAARIGRGRRRIAG